MTTKEQLEKVRQYGSLLRQVRMGVSEVARDCVLQSDESTADQWLGYTFNELGTAIRSLDKATDALKTRLQNEEYDKALAPLQGEKGNADT